jgi:hypothetical protein
MITTVTPVRPRPVLAISSVVGVITAVSLALGFLGYSSAATKLNGAAQAIGTVIVFVVVLVSHLIAAFHAQEKVTPLSSPHDALGRLLVPVEELAKPITPALTGTIAATGTSLAQVCNDATLTAQATGVPGAVITEAQQLAAQVAAETAHIAKHAVPGE